jgi:gliding motility-associated-like protein
MQKIYPALCFFLVLFGFSALEQVSAQVPNYVPKTGLVGWWPFTGNARDSSGNGNHGTVNGASLNTDRFGKSSSAYNVDGVNCSNPKGISLPCSLLNSNSYTIALWYFTTDSLKQNQTILNSSPHQFVGLSYNYIGSGNYTQAHVGNGTWLNAGPFGTIKWNTYNLKKWHHVVVVKTQSKFAFFEDGVLKFSYSFSSSFNTGTINNIVAGAISINGGVNCYETFKGNIDDIGIWNRALTECEISALYRATPIVNQVSLGADVQKYCKMDSVKLQTSRQFKAYAWSTGATTASIQVKSSGYYHVTATDSSGCIARDTVLVSIQNPRIISRDTMVCSGSTVTLQLRNSASASCASLPVGLQTGLVGWWPFCGNANDISGNGNHGTVNGAGLTQDRLGNSDRAYSFDGINDYIQTNYNGISGSANRSLSFWAKQIDVYDPSKCASCSRNPILSYGSNVMGTAQIGRGFHCEFNIGLTGISFDGNETAAAYKTFSSVNDNKWHLYTYVFDYVTNVSSVKIYQDGNLLTNLSYTYLPSSSLNTLIGNKLEFGRRTFDIQSPVYYDGALDDVMFWNRSLSEIEIKNLTYYSKLTWSTMDTGFSTRITPIGKTTVWVKADDGIGVCFDTTTVNIRKPIISLGADLQNYCGVDSFQLSASSGFKTYIWNNGKTGSKAIVKHSGYVAVAATDSFGCQAKDTVLISIQKPKVSFRDTNVCVGARLDLAVKNSGEKNIDYGYLPANLQKGLMGWWPFNANARDESGSENHGTVSGVTLSSDRFGKTQRAYSFDGINDFIEIGDPTINSLDFLGQPFTLSTWVNTTSSRMGPLLCKSNGGNTVSGDYHLTIDSNLSSKTQFAVSRGGGSGAGVNTIAAVNNGNWNHVVAVFNSTASMPTYLNSVVSTSCFGCTSTPQTLGNSTTPLFFGKYDKYKWFLKGIMDDVAIWNRALSAAEVKTLNNIGKTIYTWSTKDTSGQTSLTATTNNTVWVKADNGIGVCYDTARISVSKPVVSIGLIDSVNCYKGSDGSLTASGSNGVTPYAYKWSDALKQSTAKAGNLSKGTYKVVLTDAVGCKDSATASVQEPAKVNISISAIDSVNCYLGSDGWISTAVSGGSNGYKYLWNDAAKQTTSKASNLKKGTYKVVVRDIYGCSDSASASVHEPAKVSISISAIDSVNCYLGSDGWISTFTSGGSNGYKYLWNDAAKQTSAKASNLKKGTYKVVVRDLYGCSDSATASVQEPAKVSISISAIDSVNCYLGSDGWISTAVSGGSNGYKYLWNDAAKQTTSQASNLKKGTYKVVVRDIYGCSDSATASVQEPAKVSISISAIDSVNCYLGSDGWISTAVSGGSNGYKYLWSDAAKQTTSKASNLKKGTYKVVVRDLYGCSDSATASVQEPAKVSISISSIDSVNCYLGADGSVTTAISGGSNGYKYLWNDATRQTTSKASNLKKGPYKVMVRDIYGCSDSATASVQEPAKVNISISAIDSVNCYLGSDGWISTTTSGGSNGYKYHWNDAAKQTTSKASNLKKGTYKVVVRDIYGCSDSATASVQEPAKVSISISAIDSVNCYLGSDGWISTAVSGGSNGYKYLWNDAAKQTTSKASNLKKGTYKVLVQDIYGCSDSVTASVQEPAKVSISISAIDSVNCYLGADGSVTTAISGGSNGYKYLWNDAAKQTTSKASNLKKGTYKVVVRDLYGCSDSATASVQEPAKVSVSISAIDSVNCYLGADGSVTTAISGGSKGYKYLWNDAAKQTTSQASNLKKGTYKVVVRDIYGCSDSATASVQEPAKVSINVVRIDSVQCYGYQDARVYTSTQGGTKPYSWLWNDLQRQTTANANGLGAGKYKVLAADYYGCKDSVSVVLGEPREIKARIIANAYTMQGANLGISVLVNPPGNYRYFWSPSDVFASGVNAQNAVVVLNNETELRMQILDAKGCQGRDSFIVKVVLPIKDIIPNAFTPNRNGLNDVFGLPDIFEIQQLNIFNRWGAQLFRGSPANPSWDGTYGGETVQDGTYVYNLVAKLRGTNQIIEHSGVVHLIR